MAEIVLGIGTSHGPMLVTDPKDWGARIGFDKSIKHSYKKDILSFDELVAARKDEGLAAQITQEMWDKRYQACQDAINKLADIYDEVKPDIAVIVGNDQEEIFRKGFTPALAIYSGDTIVNQPFSEERKQQLPPAIVLSSPGYIPPEAATYESVPELGRHLTQSVINEGFDVTAMTEFPEDETPHAFGFVFRQIMRDKVTPTVPVFINTFYPPNQPTAQRCYDFGKALRRAIESWDSDAKVAIFASGGLTHFVVDEELDQTFIDCMKNRDISAMTDLGEEIYQEGTSELKNWIPVAGAMADLNFKMEVIDYVPCYRSEAGTGNAMGFVSWRPENDNK